MFGGAFLLAWLIHAPVFDLDLLAQLWLVAMKETAVVAKVERRSWIDRVLAKVVAIQQHVELHQSACAHTVPTQPPRTFWDL